MHTTTVRQKSPSSRFTVNVLVTVIALLPVLTLEAATFTVSNINDSGAGSLRAAMLAANDNPGLDFINFNISGAGVHTIKPATALPALVDPVQIDGTTQSGYSGSPLIEINGASAVGNSGFRLLGGSSVIRALAINRFSQDGIRIEGLGTNVIQGNNIGTDPSGAVERGNLREGITVNGSWANLVGGTNAGEGNLVSGNGDAGIYMLNGGRNTVQGNRIGTSVSGGSNLGNSNNGIVIYNSAGNLIGGASAGARNIVSGNRGSGMYLFGSGSQSNSISGNFVGTDLPGKAGISNVADGITIFDAPANVIGGANAGMGNLISGNGMAGLYLNGSGCSNNFVLGNFIGTDISGTSTLGNRLSGLAFSRASGNIVGGVSLTERNIISGNKESGILLSTNSVRNQIVGNFVGIDISGAKSLGNVLDGISVQSATLNVIGSNVLSGNGFYGCELSLGSSQNRLVGNLIGTDASGRSSLGNTNSGLRIESPSNLIGGSEAGEGNVVSGNLTHGIFIVGASAESNTVQGNIVGLDVSGTKALKNSLAGIVLSGAPRNQIGKPGKGNIISGNGDAGLYLYGPATIGNGIFGNRIGTDLSGKVGIANYYEGIFSPGANSNSFGGLKGIDGNLVSGNRTRGLYFTNSSWNVIQGNFIGTAGDGFSPLPNGFHGVEFDTGANNNTLGGSPGLANLIAYSTAGYSGVRVRDGSTNNAVLCDSIFGNAGLAIDLGQVGIDPLDPCDTDLGANFHQNAPVLTYAVAGPGVGITGTLNSRPNKDYLLQFYANASCVPSGQGQLYLGEKYVHTGAQCTLDFSVSFPLTIPVGYSITATATDPANNTSEFSTCTSADTVPVLSVASGSDQLLRVAWAASAKGFVLHSAVSLAQPVTWELVATPPLLANNNYVVALPMDTTNRFFRLSFE